MTAGRRLCRVLATTAILAVTASGCGPGLQDFSVGRSVAGESYPMTVVFKDATGLPIGGHVELHNVTIGRVQSMQAREFKAYVQVRITSKVKLPVGTKAQLALTTPLGEEYINLMPPAAAGAESLGANATIMAGRTSRAPDVEDLLSAFSAILNGGGVDQIHSILSELNKALDDRARSSRSLIANLNTVLSQLADHTVTIDRTLAAISIVSKQFAEQRGLLVRALTELAPGIKALSSDTAGFTKLLTHLSRLGRTATAVLNQVQGILISDLKGLTPTLDTLVVLSPGLKSALTGLRKFALLLDRAIPGDFLNLNGAIKPQ
jgi:phospholipid/cholesterol/gamma-HCH transport system substrate-binding protein